MKHPINEEQIVKAINQAYLAGKEDMEVAK